MSGVVGKVSQRQTGTVGKYPLGTIIQTVQVVKQASASHAGSSEYLWPGFTKIIYPKQPGSNILVQWKFDRGANTAVTARSYMERQIGSAGWSKLTGVQGTDSGGDPAISHAGGANAWECFGESGMYLDDPAYTLTPGTAVGIDYRFGVHNESASNIVYLGTTSRNSSQPHPNTASILMLSEISA